MKYLLSIYWDIHWCFSYSQFIWWKIGFSKQGSERSSHLPRVTQRAGRRAGVSFFEPMPFIPAPQCCMFWMLVTLQLLGYYPAPLVSCQALSTVHVASVAPLWPPHPHSPADAGPGQQPPMSHRWTQVQATGDRPRLRGLVWSSPRVTEGRRKRVFHQAW